jgi:predicted small lipoprotein YifL
MQRLKPVLLSFIIALFATACGQKGPLYLPEADAPAPQSTAEGQENKDDSGKNEENP